MTMTYLSLLKETWRILQNSSIRKKSSVNESRVKPPVSLRDYLYKYGGDFKSTSDENKKGKFGLIMSALQPGGKHFSVDTIRTKFNYQLFITS